MRCREGKLARFNRQEHQNMKCCNLFLPSLCRREGYEHELRHMVFCPSVSRHEGCQDEMPSRVQNLLVNSLKKLALKTPSRRSERCDDAAFI